MRPWKPIEEMTHDELRRYGQWLIGAWAEVDDRSTMLQIREQVYVAGKRMEELGIPSLLPNMERVHEDR